MYLGYARTVMGYGYEVCLTGDVDLIKNLVSIQYETLHESGWGPARAPPSNMVEKETAVLPLRILG